MHAGFRMFKIGQVIIVTLKEDIVQQVETEVRLYYRILIAYELGSGPVWQRDAKAQFGWLVKSAQDKLFWSLNTIFTDRIAGMSDSLGRGNRKGTEV